MSLLFACKIYSLVYVSMDLGPSFFIPRPGLHVQNSIQGKETATFLLQTHFTM